jgi:hypothetical protein
MLNTVPFKSLSGNVWVEIDAGATTNATLQLLDMGTIDFEFDLMPSDQTVASIGGIAGATSLVFDDYMSNRSSLYEILIDRLGSYSASQNLDVPKAKTTLYLQPRGSASAFRFPFEFTASDITTDLRSRQTTIELSPRTSNLNVGTWVTNVTNHFPSKISYESNQSFFVNAWASGDLSMMLYLNLILLQVIPLSIDQQTL